MDSKTFKEIVLNNSDVLQHSKKPKTLVEAMTTNFALANSDISGEFNSSLVFAWLMGVTVASTRLKRLNLNKRSQVPFCEAWGRVAKPINGKPHINERRFTRWVATDDLEQFYQETLRAIDVMESYSAPFSISSLYELAEKLDESYSVPFSTGSLHEPAQNLEDVLYYQNGRLKQNATDRFRVVAADQFLNGQNA